MRKMTAGERTITGARQALAFARGEPDHGCIVHIPAEIDVKATERIRQRLHEAENGGIFISHDDAMRRIETKIKAR